MENVKDYNILIKLILLFAAITVVTFGVKYYFQPFVSIVILLIITKPLYDLLLKVRIPSKISAAISILVINILVVIFILYLGSTVYNIASNFYKNNIYKFEGLIEGAMNFFNVSSTMQSGYNILDNSFIKSGAVSTGEWFFSYFIGNISVFFLLIDREKIINYFVALIPQRLFVKVRKQKKNIKSMVVIEVILVLISTLEITFGFTILRVGHPIFLGVVCGVLDILPYVGTIIVFIPIIIYNIIIKEYIVSFGLILLYILVQVCREILEAKFLSNKLNLHPLLILLSIYVGIKIFGIIGAIVGPIYGLLAKEIIDSKG